MKNISLILVIYIINFVLLRGQKSELYHNYFATTLELKDDGTFLSTFRFDLANQFAVGTWTGKDTIVLTQKTVYDTLNWNGRDTLVLSYDPVSSRISLEKYKEDTLYLYGQDDWFLKARYVKTKNKLYILSPNGKIVKGREHGLWTRRKFPLYYIRIDQQK